MPDQRYEVTVLGKGIGRGLAECKVFQARNADDARRLAGDHYGTTITILQVKSCG